MIGKCVRLVSVDCEWMRLEVDLQLLSLCGSTYIVFKADAS